jgi:hypothetical protein
MGHTPDKSESEESDTPKVVDDTLATEISILKPSETLFLHYCSLDAFYSIMSTGRLRFSSARSTNDPSELSFGQNCVEEFLRDMSPTVRPAEKEWLKPVIEQRQEFRAFVFCMSEAVDDEADVGELSQWRLYGSDGRGVALLFDASDPGRKELLIRLGSQPRKVFYGASDAKKLISSVLQERLDYVRNNQAF